MPNAYLSGAVADDDKYAVLAMTTVLNISIYCFGVQTNQKTVSYGGKNLGFISD